MKPEVQNALLAIFEWVKQAKEFSVAQAPDVVAQMLAYGVYSDTLWMKVMIVGVVLSVLTIIAALLMDEGFLIFTGCLGLLIFGLPAVVFYVELQQIKMAPKVYIIEQIANMTRGQK